MKVTLLKLPPDHYFHFVRQSILCIYISEPHDVDDQIHFQLDSINGPYKYGVYTVISCDPIDDRYQITCSFVRELVVCPYYGAVPSDECDACCIRCEYRSSE